MRELWQQRRGPIGLFLRGLDLTVFARALNDGEINFAVGPADLAHREAMHRTASIGKPGGTILWRLLCHARPFTV